MRIKYQVRDAGNCDVTDGIAYLDSPTFQAKLARWFAEGHAVEMWAETDDES